MDNSNKSDVIELLEILHENHVEVLKTQTEMQLTLARFAVSLDAYNANLEKHMSRTEASEKRLEVVENQVMFVNKLFKIIAYIGSVGYGLAKLANYLKSLLH